MMDPSMLSYISLSCGIIGASSGLLAAALSFRSSTHAREAVNRAQKIEASKSRELIRDVITAAQNAVTESIRVERIMNKLKATYRELSTFSGQPEGNTKRILTEQIEKKRKKIAAYRQDAMNTLNNLSSLKEKEETLLTDDLLKFEGYTILMIRIRETLEQNLAAVERVTQTYRTGYEA